MRANVRRVLADHLDGVVRPAMLSSKGRVPMATSAGRVDRRLWLVSVASIAAILTVGIVIDRSSPSHVASPVILRLAAAAIITVCAGVAKLVAGSRAAAATGVLGTLVAVVLLTQLS